MSESIDRFRVAGYPLLPRMQPLLRLLSIVILSLTVPWARQPLCVAKELSDEQSADISGKWTSEYDVTQRDFTAELEINQIGDCFNGVIQFEQRNAVGEQVFSIGLASIQDGRVHGNKARFKVINQRGTEIADGEIVAKTKVLLLKLKARGGFPYTFPKKIFLYPEKEQSSAD
jgi:hypothetical protein